jgi:hypothetical protein
MCMDNIHEAVRERLPVCLSGGATGSDTAWGHVADRMGHAVIHWSFGRHRTTVPARQLLTLSDAQLQLANPAVSRANKTLRRQFPSNSWYTNNLLRRNWYQVAFADSVFAVGECDANLDITGGTAWAVQMYIDRFVQDQEDMEKCRLFFFDQIRGNWRKWKGSWAVMDCQPTILEEIWAGIGTRDLNGKGLEAIKAIAVT